MNLFLLTGKEPDSRLAYVNRFLSGILGYPYATGSQPDKARREDVVITYGSPDPKKILPGQTVLEIYNSGQLHHLEELEKTVNLFEWRGRALPILGPQTPKENLKGWRFNRVNGFYTRQKGSHILIPFDLLANIFYHLSRYEEKWRHFAEETLTDHSTSVLTRHHGLDDPLVDGLVAFLDVIIRKSLASFVRILPWPGGQPFAIAFTHDVDLTRGAGLKKRLVHRGLDLISKIGAGTTSAEALKAEIAEADAQVWTYPQLLELYQRKNCRASFYFLVKMFEGLHFRYNLTSRKFRRLIAELSEDGHEIGLHSSLKAFDKSGKYTEERQRLANIIRNTVTGLRQHYLRAKFPRLWQLAADAGFGYDSSLGYNYQYGFRAGTSHPFECFNYKTNKILPLWEFSLAFFEHNLPGEAENPEDLIAIVEKIIGKVEVYEGLVVGLLHPSNFLNPIYQRLWEWFVGQVEQRGAFTGSLAEIMNWVSDRQKIELHTTAPGEISVRKPAAVKSFAIELSEKLSLRSSEDYRFEQVSGNRYRITASGKHVKLLLN